MPIEVTHRGHAYTYHHPVGWSGGDEQVRQKLNEHRPAAGYPDEDAERVAVDHALASVLAGGEIVRHHDTGAAGALEPEAREADIRPSNQSPDRILEEPDTGTGASDPERVLDDTDSDPDDPSGDPDRILDGQR